MFICLSCNSSNDTSPLLSTIKIESSSGDLLDIGESTTLSVKGFDSANNLVDITQTIVWTVNNSNAQINPDGVVTGLSVGTSNVKASIGNVENTIDINIWDSSAPRTEIYVSDAGNVGNPPYQILKFDENGENPKIFTNQNLNWPQDILFMEGDEIALISNLNSGSIGRYNINTGDYINDFALGIGGPTRMKIGPDDLLYVLQWRGNGKVLRYQLDGTFVDEFTSVGVTQSIGIDWDSNGNLYVSSYNNGSGGSVRKFDTSGNDLGLFANTNLNGPTNIWFTSEGNLMVNDWSTGRIVKFSAEGDFIENAITGLNRPEGVAFFSNGDFLIGNGGTSSIKKYNSENGFVKDLITRGSGSLLTPNAVVIRKVNH